MSIITGKSQIPQGTKRSQKANLKGTRIRIREIPKKNQRPKRTKTRKSGKENQDNGQRAGNGKEQPPESPKRPKQRRNPEKSGEEEIGDRKERKPASRREGKKKK